MTARKKIVFSTGAGVSAESGITTFRDAGGLWEKHNVMDVASHEGFLRNPALVHSFYNARRRDMLATAPNEAHRAIAELEKDYDVYVITQNVDELHEMAGSSQVMHLHGKLMSARALDDDSLTWKLTPDNYETTPETIIDGHHVRPDIVFFGEAVPMFEPAVELVAQADIFVIIGTTLSVYPAAALLRYVKPGTPVYYIDPNPAQVPHGVTVIAQPATTGMRTLMDMLRK